MRGSFWGWWRTEEPFLSKVHCDWVCVLLECWAESCLAPEGWAAHGALCAESGDNFPVCVSGSPSHSTGLLGQRDMAAFSPAWPQGQRVVCWVGWL